MSNIVEFVVKMKDSMSGSLHNLSSASQSAFNRMAQQANRMIQRNQALEMSYNQLQRRIREVENTIKKSSITSKLAETKRELASWQREAAGYFRSMGGGESASKRIREMGNTIKSNIVDKMAAARHGLISWQRKAAGHFRSRESVSAVSGSSGIGGMVKGSILKNLRGNIALTALGFAKDGIGAMISGSMQKEKNITELSTFLGDKGAKAAYQNIRQDADNSSYDTDTLLKANQALISVDGNAEAAREDIMNLANALSAVGSGNDKLQQMAMNMQQIKSLGVASAEDIQQFGYAGINIYGLLSQATGKNIEKVKNMDVSYDLLAKSLALSRMKGGIYEGALEKENNTMSGKWETLKNRGKNTLADIGDAFSPIISDILDIALKLSKMISSLLNKIRPFIDMISNTMRQQLSTLWKIISGILDWLSKSELVRDIFKAIYFVAEKIIKIIGWISEKIGEVWDNFIRPCLDNLEKGYKWIKSKLGFSDSPSTSKSDPSPNSSNNSEEMINKLKHVFSFFDPNDPKSTNLTRFKNAGVGEGKKEKNKTKSKETGDTIAGGGTKYITINLGKFFDNIQFTTMNMKESEQDIERILMEMMGRVLYNGAKNM